MATSCRTLPGSHFTASRPTGDGTHSDSRPRCLSFRWQLIRLFRPPPPFSLGLRGSPFSVGQRDALGEPTNSRTLLFRMPFSKIGPATTNQCEQRPEKAAGGPPPNLPSGLIGIFWGNNEPRDSEISGSMLIFREYQCVRDGRPTLPFFSPKHGTSRCAPSRSP